MDRQQRLALERNAHLTVRELREAHPELAEPFVPALEAGTTHAAAAVVTGRSDRLRALADGLVLPITGDVGVRDATIQALRDRIGGDDPELHAELDDLAGGPAGDLTVTAAIGLDDPVALHPQFASELANARLDRLSEAARIDPADADVLVDELGDIGQVREDRLATLVDAGRLSPAAAGAAGRAAALYNLLDERPELVARFGPEVEPRQLARLDQAAWVDTIRDSGTTPPGGLTAEAYADLLARKVEQVFPTAALAVRLDRPVPADLLSSVDARTTLAARYPGLRLAEVLDDEDRPADDRVAEIERRVGLVGTFLAGNPDAMSFDLTTASPDLAGLTFDPAASDGDRAGVLATVRAYQRMTAVTGGVDKGEKMVAAGFPAAWTLARSTPEIAADLSGLTVEEIRPWHEHAQVIATNVGLRVGAMADHVRDELGPTGAGNQSLSIADYLKEIPGYAALFGSQDFCECTHCRSILGPAAYLYDLLSFVDETVTRWHFANRPDHPLALRSRRPDLWTLALTCENTNTVVPYLTVINEVLENATATDSGYTGDLRNRGTVGTWVYQQTLPSRVDSFQQPFQLPFQELRTYLRHFKRTLADLAEAAGADGATRARLRLDLAPREYELITQPNADLAFLSSLYGAPLTETGTQLGAFDATGLLGPMGVTRPELGELIATRYVTAGTAIRIVAGKRNVNSVQDDVETVLAASRAALDRLHRFVRLWRATGWRIAELDLVLDTTAATGARPVIAPGSVSTVAGVRRLGQRYGVSVEELVGLFAPLPTDPVSGASLFARIFNPPDLVGSGGAYPQDGTAFLHPALRSTPATGPQPHLRRLQAGTGTDEDQLYQLVVGLAVPLGIDLDSTDDADKDFPLTRRNLTLLWRHARLARLLEVTVPELFALIALAPEIGSGHVDDLDDLEALLRLYTWARTTRWTTADLLAIVRPGTPGHAPVLPGPAEPTATQLATTLVDGVRQTGALSFADTVFALVRPLTDTQSRDIVAANPAVFEPAGTGRYRLAAGYDPTAALTLPAGVDVALAPQLRAVLAAYHGERVLRATLPGAVASPPAAAAELVTMTGAQLGSAAVFAELRGDTAPTGLAALIDNLRRLARLFADAAVFTPERLAFVRTNASRFGIADFTDLETPAVQAVERFRTLLAGRVGGDEPIPDLAGAIVRFDAGTGFDAADRDVLATVLGCDVGLLRSLEGQVPLGSAPLPATERLGRAVALVRELGTGGAVLGLAQSAAYPALAEASAAVQAAIRAGFTDEQAWQSAVEPYQDDLLSLRRDALVAYLLRSANAPFDKPNDLYHYYLLDVKLEGCARTSLVAAAIDSLQLYVQRCLMNYEESPAGAVDPVHVLPTSIPAAQWEWRGSYRFWRAAREVFLNPESFLKPGMRGTPLLRELEDSLLSKQITEDTILDAYGHYLRGFEELAHLAIAGAYHEKDDQAQRDTLHLFGVNAADPPVYYYRRVENARYGVGNPARATEWGPWQPLDVQIPVRKVSPVVYQGQLYVFWVRYTTNPLNTLSGGESRFSGYQHRAHVEFTKRRLDGSWTPPQKLRLTETPFNARGDGVILDPLVPRRIGQLPIPFLGAIPLYMDFQPLYDDRVHEHPQEGYTLRGFMWDQVYAGAVGGVSLRGADFQMWSAVDLYRLAIQPRIEEFSVKVRDPSGQMVIQEGVPWLHPSIFFWIWLFSGGKFDLTSLLPPRLVWSRADAQKRVLHSTKPGIPAFDTYTFATLLLDEEHVLHYTRPPHVLTTAPRWGAALTDYLRASFVEHRIGDIPTTATLDVVNGSVGDVILQTSDDAFYLQYGAGADGRYLLRRFRTTVSADMGDTLYNQGLEQLLATTNQLNLKEHATGITLDPAEVQDASGTGGLDFNGPMGQYLGEVFFHIPWLIANYFNSQGMFQQAERWYRFIFDPTSAEVITGIDPNRPPEEQRRRQLDRVWRFRELRGLDATKLRQELTDSVALYSYHQDPFNPDAIARHRPTAYRKAIVMNYVDNLLDWGDELFAQAFSQQNPEYLREATLRYVTAQELLGERPAQLGDCGDSARPMTYPAIKAAAVAGGSEFLIEVESIIWPLAPSLPGGRFVPVTAEAIAAVTDQLYSLAPAATPVAPDVQLERWDARPVEARMQASRFGSADVVLAATPPNRLSTSAVTASLKQSDSRFANSVVISVIVEINPAFCIPRGVHVLDCWDRVEDRLFKLRHCLDPDGVPRQLPLFAPRIDPGLLVGGRAAGLTLQDVLAGAGSDVPPHRFQFLVDKARPYAATAQALGSGMLAAIEKRDVEELSRLRNTHQRNILALTTEVRANELKLATESVELAKRRLTAAEYRRDYYATLIQTGNTPIELVQSVHQIAAGEMRLVAGVMDTVAAIAHLIPQAGSPFSMKYGGLEVGMSATSWAEVVDRSADVADAVADLAGLTAGQERREQGWEHQRTLGQHDVVAAERELAAAQVRLSIAARAVELHRTAIEQQDDVIALSRDRFTNFAQYVSLSQELQKLHREAYDNALTMAMLAQRAYRFERPGDNTVFIGGEWDASRSGLLAGDRLGVALQRMERRFVETDDRELEINQSFSLAQLDPAALVTLKETGVCEFNIAELHMDIFYPGQYRRRIRAVRLTIPCITGPYTNVSARLSLVRSYLRNDPTLAAAELREVPRTRAVAISTAQGDAGVFELSFRDAQYLPFEGGGAVSRWRLELPMPIRPFDYHSMTDVILNLSYTAQEDGTLRQQVQSLSTTVQQSLLSRLRGQDLVRVFSLRQEFSSAFNRLMRAPAATPVTLDITDRHFPLFLSGWPLTTTSSTMVLAVTDHHRTVGAAGFTVDGTDVNSFPAPDASPDYGGLPAKAIGGTFGANLKSQHTVTVKNLGDLRAAPGATTLDDAKLRDVLLVVKYRIATPP
jgi:hypothetical protein